MGHRPITLYISLNESDTRPLPTKIYRVDEHGPIRLTVHRVGGPGMNERAKKGLDGGLDSGTSKVIDAQLQMLSPRHLFQISL